MPKNHLSRDGIKSGSIKKIAIITSYFAGELYGLLGPQMAAALIEAHTPYEAIVVAVAREDDKVLLKGALSDYFGGERPVVGFSSLSGREDLFDFAAELTASGCFTILAGPQAEVDFRGEIDCREFPHRFQGLSSYFSCALQGPAEACFRLLASLDADWRRDVPGLLYSGADGAVMPATPQPWDEKYFRTIRWDNIYRLESSRFVPHRIRSAQVLHQLGCPYAVNRKRVEIDYPAFLHSRKEPKIRVLLKGCGFCDIAADKGFWGAVGMETVLRQIRSLPADADGRKIPFELINENPLPGILPLLRETEKRRIAISRINLIMRADWFLKGLQHLREALQWAGNRSVRIVLTSVGFESFDDTILRNLNKGLTVKTILKAVSRMRRLNDEFPDVWGYTRADGANHGFIHPTPWDSEKTSQNIQDVIDRCKLAPDILPDHSTPLIIHHASGLADWIRRIEEAEAIQFRRHGSIIAWWPE